jgi:hypothetical protein
MSPRLKRPESLLVMLEVARLWVRIIAISKPFSLSRASSPDSIQTGAAFNEKISFQPVVFSRADKIVLHE